MSALTAGVDVGTSAVKVVLVEWIKGQPKLVASQRERIHRRDPAQVARVVYEGVLEQAKAKVADVIYVASTGEGDELPFRDGHFYGMTTHARGAQFLFPKATAAIDIGALHARVMAMDSESRVLRSKMTSQCAAGTGQFLENIARYLGIRADEVGPLSLEAQKAEPCSGICAVLSETDVINMVSRGTPRGEILRGVHDSIAQRLARLLRSAAAEGVVALTGGLASDIGLKGALERQLATDNGPAITLEADSRSVLAGAIGAALWAHHRHQKLAERKAQPAVAHPA
ncbi:MAG: benzoyl-CoA reductase (4-electron) delta subunit [Myxococcaceae bacterium]|nr:benzoyl-CoA reductase (4-electron) delta subunit [Myxococcaceae bacterium]